MERLKIEYLPLDALKPYERNAKEHPREQVEQIKESIRQMGMNDPIGIWGEECLIVEGHGRLLALQELGYTEAPTIRLDHLTDEQRRAYTLIHNKTTMNSGFDFEMLHSELEELDIDMTDFGFADTEFVDVDGLFEDSEPKAPKEEEEKEIKCPHCGMYFKAE